MQGVKSHKLEMTEQNGAANQPAAVVVPLVQWTAREWLAAAAELTEESLAAWRENLPLRYPFQGCNVYQW